MASTFLDQALASATEQRFVGTLNWCRKTWSPFFRRHVQNTADGVSKADWSLGRGNNASGSLSPYTDYWVINRHFMKGLGGYVNFEPFIDPAEDAVFHTGTAASVNYLTFGQTMYNLQSSPGPDLTVAPVPFEWQIPLTKMEGSFDFPVEIKRAAEIGASKVALYDKIIERTAVHQALYECLSWWCHTETFTVNARAAQLEGVLAKLADVTVTLAADSVATVTLDTGSIKRFMVGQAVSLIHADADEASNNLLLKNAVANVPYPLRITAVDYYANTVTIVNRRIGGSTATCTVTFATGDKIFLVPFNCHPAFYASSTATISGSAANDITFVETAMPHGPDRFIKNSGTLYGVPTGTGINVINTVTGATQAVMGLSLTRHPEYRSYVRDMGGQAIDEVIFGEFHSLAGYSQEDEHLIDTWVGGEHFWSGIVNNLQGYYTFERQGAPVDPVLGIQNDPYDQGMELNWLGRKYRIYVDSWVSKGTTYGLITRNQNFKRYVPPRLPGAGSMGGFQEVEFLAPARGYSSIFEPVRNSSNSAGVDAVTAPFRKAWQIVPDVMPGVKLTNVGGNIAPFA